MSEKLALHVCRFFTEIFWMRWRTQEGQSPCLVPVKWTWHQLLQSVGNITQLDPWSSCLSALDYQNPSGRMFKHNTFNITCGMPLYMYICMHMSRVFCSGTVLQERTAAGWQMFRFSAECYAADAICSLQDSWMPSSAKAVRSPPTRAHHAWRIPLLYEKMTLRNTRFHTDDLNAGLSQGTNMPLQWRGIWKQYKGLTYVTN